MTTDFSTRLHNCSNDVDDYYHMNKLKTITGRGRQTTTKLN